MNIYQIYYDDSQLSSLEPEFIPFDNRRKEYPFNYEYAVFFELHKKNNWLESKYCGALSWKFRSKTGNSGKDFIEAINSSPGYDVYLINPFPELIIYKSVWDQGDEFHPHIRELTKLLLLEVGHDPSMLETETAPQYLCYCNYWVGNKKFWDAYIEYLNPIWRYILEHDNSLTRALKVNADPLIQAPYLPFVFERLFSTFLSISSFKVLSLPVSSSKLEKTGLERFNVFLRNAINSQNYHQLNKSELARLKRHFLKRKLLHYHARVLYRRVKSIFLSTSFRPALKTQDLRKLYQESQSRSED